MEFIETSIFTKQIKDLMTDDEYRLFQNSLVEKPDCGKLIQGGGGIRKVRWAIDNGKGKSGGIRVIYYYKNIKNQILLMFAYPKNVADNLTDLQTKALAEIAKGFNNEEK